jgi:hypothetical protein
MNNNITTQSANEIEESGNYLQFFPYRAPKKNHETDAAGDNGRIRLSLNGYADLVSRRVLLNILGASSNNETYGFFALRTAAICSWNFGLNSK